jgi:alpha-amylase/alpha-mannosidase (GH57 family)
MSTAHLDLVFLWHMHQPDYRDRGSQGSGNSNAGGSSGEFVMPWVYLHAMKDYADMAAHLERHPGIRCVVNFVPVLLDQLEDYSEQFASGKFRDPLLRLLATPDLGKITRQERHMLLDTCFQSNHVTMLTPFPRYQRLHHLYQHLVKEGEGVLDYLSSAYFSDLVTWYHLAWTGESERRANPLITTLLSKGEGYDAKDRAALVASIGQLVSGIIPRYRALSARGQIEISSTPQTHPLSPLLLDFKVARESVPDAPLPVATAYPGGHTRVLAQIQAAQSSHAVRFGAPPVGMWPAEGAVSETFVHHLAESGVRWIASGQGVLNNSLAGVPDVNLPQRPAYRPWQLAGAPGLTLFFRDERLSDLIGFDYAKWHGRAAAQHLIGELEAILAATPEGETAVVGIILDGENAWEHYPYNGYYFFDDLYSLLAKHPGIHTTTYGSLLDRNPEPAATVLPRLTAGSWVYGSLSTWIGDTQKNRAWDLLCTAKQSFDLVHASGRLGPEESALATRQLAICESSDWFWWFGDYNPATAVASFDGLFRRNLALLYRLLQLDPPAQLQEPISTGASGAGTGANGSMRRTTESST